MGYINGTDRGQTKLVCYEDYIAKDNMVRVIDRFIDTCDLRQMGFTGTIPAETGRPAYPPAALTKLYVYGYENGIRSSRKLERECRINVEVMWLLGGLTPDYKTISEFRRMNIRPMQKLFHKFVSPCKEWDMIGGELIAIDGTKIKASNNKKNNFSRKKLEARLLHIDERINEYMTAAENDDETESKAKPEQLDELNERKALYERYMEKLNETGENELSAVDPDARLMGNNRGGVEMAYNVQSAVDAKAHIAVEFDVTKNPADHGGLGVMVKKVKKRLKLRRFAVVADKGYYNGADLARVKRYKVKAIVSKQKAADPKDQPKEFNTDKFKYDERSDTYTCPMEKTLYPHSKKSADRRNFFNKSACEKCEFRGKCTNGQSGYRTVSRNKYAKVYDEVDKRTIENMHLYKLRQQIIEHTFGTIKFNMQGYYFLLRTQRKVRCETAMLFLGYNLKRAYKYLGFKEILARLDAICRIFEIIAKYMHLESNITPVYSVF